MLVATPRLLVAALVICVLWAAVGWPWWMPATVLAAALIVAELWARRGRRGHEDLERARPRKAGAVKGQIVIGPEFDEIPDGFEQDPNPYPPEEHALRTAWDRGYGYGLEQERLRGKARKAYFDRLEQNLPPWAVSISEAAQELGVTQEEVRSLIADRKLGAVAGRIVTRGALASYIRRRDLEQFSGPELTDPWSDADTSTES